MSVLEGRRKAAERCKVVKVCAHRKCDLPPTEAHDVHSWFMPFSEQVPAHYEVCEKHAHYFAPPFNGDKSAAVRRDLVEWATLNGPAIEKVRKTYEFALQSITSIAYGPGRDEEKVQDIKNVLDRAKVPERDPDWWRTEL